MALLIWCYLLFILLLHGCIAPIMYKPTDDKKLHETRRSRIIKYARNDPCSREGMCVFRDEKEQKRAKRLCEDAYNAFVALPPEEQSVCHDAMSPDCRGLPVCENLTFGCTFLCEENSLTWITLEDGCHQQAFRFERKEKHLKDIGDALEALKPKRKRASSSGSGQRNIKRRLSGNQP